MAAVGYSGATLNPNEVDLFLASGSEPDQSKWSSDRWLQLVRAGQPYQIDEDIATRIYQGQDITIKVRLAPTATTMATKQPTAATAATATATEAEQHSITMWTCDLSKEYVAINADYRS